MRKIALGQPSFDTGRSPPEIKWIVNALREIASASNDQITEEIADAYTIGTFTVTRTLNPATATTSDIANVLATLLKDMKNRGVKRG